MPTSSQALILQVNDGHLPSIFGRRVWRHTQSYQYPVTHININQRIYQARNRAGLRQGHIRTGSSHDIRTGLSTLPDLLRIQGLKGSLFYEKGTNSIHYDIETLPETRYNGWTVTLTGDNDDGRYGSHGFQKGNTSQFADYSDTNHILSSKMKDPKRRRPHEFLKMEPSGEMLQLKKDAREEADFFKLVKVLKTETDNQGAKNYFQLIKTSQLEPGAFRLAKTDLKEVGAFYLVPPDGYESNDFRLLPSEQPGCYSILQADPWKPGNFMNLEPDKVYGDEFKLVIAKPRSTHALTSSNDLPDTNERVTSDTVRSVNAKAIDTVIRNIQRNIDTQSNEYQGGYFDEILDQKEQTNNYARRKEFSLPDIMLNDPKKRLHNPLMVREEGHDFNAQQFAAKYLSDVDGDQSEEYQKLVEIGIQRAREDTEQRLAAHSKDLQSGSSSKRASCDWRTYNFDKWTRTTEIPQTQDFSLTAEIARFIQPNVANSEPIPSKASLLEELKMNSNFKQWKKKKVTGIRMRKEPPPEDPTAVCLCLKDNAIPHNVLLQQVQKETDGHLASLQFDPVSVHSQDSDAKSQWILRLTDEISCEKLLTSGICIMGTTYPVRRFNDVMKEEYEAYKFKMIMQQIKEHNDVKTQKNKKSKKMKTTQTQTPR